MKGYVIKTSVSFASGWVGARRGQGFDLEPELARARVFAKKADAEAEVLALNIASQATVEAK